MAGTKRAPKHWYKLSHIQKKYIKGRLYIYRYDPPTKQTAYLGAAEPVFSTIQRLAARQRKHIVEAFERGDSIYSIIDYIATRTNTPPMSRQAVYRWFAAEGIITRWIKE